MKEPIKIWQWEDAPECWRELSENGGDEDWIAYVPKEYGEYPPVWMDEGTQFGCCILEEHRLQGGTIYIGCHS